MRVFILTEGGRRSGFGHIIRCSSLCDAFKSRGITLSFLVNGDGVVGDLLRKNHRVFNWLKERKRLFKMIEGADIVIVDSYMAEPTFYRKISDLVRVAAYMDELKRIDYPKGVVINGNIYAEKLAYPKKKDMKYLLGTKYVPLRKEFWIMSRKKVRKHLKKIMVTCGGGDFKDLTPKILRMLNTCFPRIIKRIIVGKGFSKENIRSIKKAKDGNTELIFYPSAARIKSVMLESDMAISTGGQTMYELAVSGTPAIGICVADNQEMILKEWKRIGFLEYAGWYYQKGLLDKVRDAITCSMASASQRKRRIDIGTSYVDGKGAHRTVSALVALLFSSERHS